jgi:hypothetical protein
MYVNALVSLSFRRRPEPVNPATLRQGNARQARNKNKHPQGCFFNNLTNM